MTSLGRNSGAIGRQRSNRFADNASCVETHVFIFYHRVLKSNISSDNIPDRPTDCHA